MSNELLSVYDGLESAIGALNAALDGFYACTHSADFMPKQDDIGSLFNLVMSNINNELARLNELVKMDDNQQ